MKKLTMKITIFLIFSTLAITACTTSPKVDWDVKISGAVENPMILSFADLVKMPQTELKDILMDKSIGEDETTSWSGVQLETVFMKAGAADNFVTLTALAADGYAIEISKDELKDAIIALKQNDEWIQKADPEHGPLRLVCPQTPANRWVYQLTEIQINQ